MAEVNFELYNNQLVQQLVGASDANLRLIEKILNVEISSFGNQINIKGSQDAVDQAKTAIDLLYGKVSKGIEIGEQEVKAAVRMSEEGPEKIDGQNLNDIVLKTKKRHIYPRSATQAKYIQEMMKNELVFGLGPAGTGKTYLAVALAVSMMLEGKIDKIILSRPAVEIAPLAFMRGRTLSNAFVILDEAQNTTPMQMKMFLTRLGENSRMVVNGDLSQVDLPRGVISGLKDALDTLENVSSISSVTFSANDVVRHGLVAKIVKAYEEKGKKQHGYD